jgi:dipeptide transport system substrate-binding protein
MAITIPRRASAALLALYGGLGAHAAQVMTVCTEAAPEGFDVVQYELAVTNDAAGIPVYDTLTQFKTGSSELMPGLAERWDISADGLSYTLHLRQGVRFHTTPWFKPTRAMNADDVLFSINRMFDKSHWAHASAGNGYVYWAGMEMSLLIKAVEKIGEHSVRFTLSRPNAPFLSNLAIPNIGAVYPAEYAAQLLKAGQLGQLNTLPVGTGPFVFRSYQKDAVVRYDAHAQHWRGRPALDQLIFAITTDPDVRVQRVKAGECLMGHGLKGQSVVTLGADKNLQVVRNSALATSYLALNTKHPALADKRLRQALWLAIDKKVYVEAVYGGQARPAASFLPPGIWSHDKTLKDRADPQQARALVKASGYDGKALRLFYTKGSNLQRAAELLQADWAGAGLKVALEPMELGALFKRTAAGEHDIALISWYSDNGDPDNFFSPNLSCAAAAAGGNKAHWCDSRFDALLDAANRTFDTARRTALYTQAQGMLWEDVPVIPLTYPLVITALHQRVQGFVPSPFNNLFLHHVRLQP